MKAIFTLLSAFLCFFATSQAQVEREDSATFRKYAMLRIQPTVNLRTLQELYQYWQAQDEGENAAVHIERVRKPTDQPTLYWNGL